MSRRGKRASIFYAVSILMVVLCAPAYAYLDPGSWSFVFQLLIAGVLGGLYAVGVYWGKLTAFVRGLFGKRKEDTKEDE